MGARGMTESATDVIAGLIREVSTFPNRAFSSRTSRRCSPTNEGSRR